MCHLPLTCILNNNANIYIYIYIYIYGICNYEKYNHMDSFLCKSQLW